MENSIADFWITEKVFTIFRNDAIPIYRGSMKNRQVLIDHGVNVKAFIDASNMTSDELISCLDSLNNEKGKMKLDDMYLQPLIPDKVFFDEHLRNNFQQILDNLEKS